MTLHLTYQLNEIEPYINWIYFFHAWGMQRLDNKAKETLRKEAGNMLTQGQEKYHTYAAFRLFQANSDNDDLLLDGIRIPMLRQQTPSQKGEPTRCLADYVRPLSSGIADHAGAFAATVDKAFVDDYCGDDYLKLLAVTLADRLAEATAEKLHEDVRKHIWGYAPEELLTPSQLFAEQYQGLRPAVGYPSLPDMSVNFLLSDLIGMKEIGIQLTENGMMIPHASVSGFMFSHPQATHFSVGAIGEDQLADYARRRDIPLHLMRKFLKVQESPVPLVNNE